jgi:hypothetical protein
MAYKHIDTETGEVSFNIKYAGIGRPRQYRFDGQKGRFNIDGTRDMGVSLTIQPIAWRIFEENLFARNRNEVWAELFFVDSSNALSSIMFNNNSVNELYNLIDPLFYDDLQLSDVVLTIRSEKKTNKKIEGAGTWFLAQFEYTKADPATVAELAEFARKYPVYRIDTMTPTAVYHVRSELFMNGLELPQPERGTAPTIEATAIAELAEGVAEPA